MQKPAFLNLENDINALINSSEPFIYSREELQEMIMSLLKEAYETLNKLDEARFRHNLPKVADDRSNIKVFIDHCEKIIEKALENEDEDLLWRYRYAKGMYETFQKDPSSAIGVLRIAFLSAKLDERTPEFKGEYLAMLEKHHPEEFIKKSKYFANLDLFFDLYKQFEGYQVTEKLILKSSALRIFRFFEVVTKVQKKALATNIEYLFASLGENLSVNSKRAGSLRVVGEFNGFPLYDYLGNSKTLLNDFGLEELFMDLLTHSVKKFREAGLEDKANALMIGKTTLQLSVIDDLLKL